MGSVCQHCPGTPRKLVSLTALSDRSVERDAGTLTPDVLAGEHPGTDLAIDKRGLSLGHRDISSGSSAGGENSDGEQSDDVLEVEHFVCGLEARWW